MKIKFPSWLRQPSKEPFRMDLTFPCPCGQAHKIEVREPYVRVFRTEAPHAS